MVRAWFNCAMNKKEAQEALDYHSQGRKGKLEVVATKPTATQRDLSLAYSPGVAQPCREIDAEPLRVFDYTAKGNLIGVISNGTAVLGLGDIGPLASKPVMEGKGVLFKRFADIDVFDLEIDTKDVDEFVRTVQLLEPTFGGINLEDIKAPECFEIERRLKEVMSIPVFHDDQHGTAIISAAALLNALEIVGKEASAVKMVISGAGAAAVSCRELYVKLGLGAENILVCDSTGVIYAGRQERMGPVKEALAVATEARSLADAMVGADVFVGLSVGGLVSGEMLESMASQPIVFALANPDPEIGYAEAKAVRDDVIMATGRSDFPNQVNNVLGFPFIFRGALDVRATDINEEMKLAAVRALAEMATEDVPDSVLKAYGIQSLRFGPDYLIPKPFDHRVLLRVAPAVAAAAMESGVARAPIDDMRAYSRRLETLISRRFELMHGIMDRARRAPKKIVFPEGENEKILRAAKTLVDRGIAHPILLARREKIEGRLAELDLPMESVTIIHNESSPDFDRYAQELHRRRRRDGVTTEDADKLMRSRNYFGAMMVEAGDADGLISGVTQHYNETIKPALQVVGLLEGVRRVSGAYVLLFRERVLLLADTTVNIDPSAQELAEIALLTANFARRFDVEPRVAMLSFSNFGSNDHPSARKARRAVEIAQELDPELVIEGEMQADTALLQSILDETYPWSRLKEPANILVFPELQSANIAYKLLWRLADVEAIGPILLGMDKPVHVLQRGVEVADIVNMSALCVVDVQERESHRPPNQWLLEDRSL